MPSSPLITEVDKPFLQIPVSSSQQSSSSLDPNAGLSWAQQQIAGQGGNTLSWLPSTDPIKKEPQITLDLGTMGTMSLLPTDQKITIPNSIKQSVLPVVQTSQSQQPVVQSVKPQQSSSQTSQTQAAQTQDIAQAIVDSTVANNVSDAAGINPSYLVYGFIALVTMIAVIYLYQEDYF